MKKPGRAAFTVVLLILGCAGAPPDGEPPITAAKIEPSKQATPTPDRQPIPPGLQGALDEDESDGFVTHEQTQVVLNEWDHLARRHNELRAQFPDSWIGIARGEVFAGETLWQVMDSVAAKFPGALMVLEAPPNPPLNPDARPGLPPVYYSLNQYFKTLDDFLEDAPQHPYPDYPKSAVDLLRTEKLDFEGKRSEISASLKDGAVAVLSGKVFAGETTSELADALRAAGCPLVYCEDPIGDHWDIVEPLAVFGESTRSPRGGSHVIARVTGTRNNGEHVSRLWNAGISTATRPSHVDRRILRGMQPNYLGLLVFDERLAHGTGYLNIFDGVTIAVRYTNGQEVEWGGPFLISNLGILGVDFLRATGTGVTAGFTTELWPSSSKGK